MVEFLLLSITRSLYIYILIQNNIQYLYYPLLQMSSQFTIKYKYLNARQNLISSIYLLETFVVEARIAFRINILTITGAGARRSSRTDIKQRAMLVRYWSTRGARVRRTPPCLKCPTCASVILSSLHFVVVEKKKETKPGARRIFATLLPLFSRRFISWPIYSEPIQIAPHPRNFAPSAYELQANAPSIFQRLLPVNFDREIFYKFWIFDYN